jgi:hypothetical protein
VRGISTAMATFLQGAVLTLATCVQITRTDGQVFGFTDHDTNLVYNGITFASAAGYTASAIQASNNLSTSNLEIDALLLAEGGAVTQPDIEAGVWDNAAVIIFAVNYANLEMGQINLTAGNLGQFTIANGGWKVELRGLAQALQQTIGRQYTPGCSATFGDSKCTINLAPLTFTGSVASVSTAGLAWTDPTLTQGGAVSDFVDTVGHEIPTASPYQVVIVPPSGSFQANTSVVDGGGTVYGDVASGPGNQQYSVTINSNGTATYTFSSNNAGEEVFINYTFAEGYFTYGKVKWLTGQNAGFSNDVKIFAPGNVTLALPTYYPIAVGDTYSIVAGCDKAVGTCASRYNNVVNFRGFPAIPGPDVLLAPQS